LYESKGKRIAKERENAIPAGVPQELWVKMKAYQNQLKNEKNMPNQINYFTSTDKKISF